MRKLLNTMVAASAEDTPIRRMSASSSDLARSVSYRTSRVRSPIAAETRSPTDRSSTSAGLADPGSAIAFSSLLRRVLGRAGNLPCGTRHTAHPPLHEAGRTGQAPCAAVTSRLRHEILRDHHRGAGQHARAAARLAWPVPPGQANGAPAGAPSLTRQARVTKRTFSVPGGPPPRAPEAGANALWPTVLARLPRLVARGYPVAVPGPLGP